MYKLGTIFKVSTLLMATAAVMHAANPTAYTPAPPTTLAITYTKGAGSAAGTSTSQQFKLGLATGDKGAVYISVTSAIPWLQMDKVSGTATAASPLTFTLSPSQLAVNLPPGPQTSQTITITGTYYPASGASSSMTSVNISVTLTVIDAPAQISASLVSAGGFNWSSGAAYPTATLTVTSSSEPISFSLTVATTNPSSAWILPVSTSGIAYPWGDQITINFLNTVFDAASSGTSLVGSITVKGPNNTVVVPVTFLIGSPAATASSSSPSTLPQKIASGTTRVVAVTGANFAAGIPVRVGSTTNPPLINNCSGFAAATTDALCIQSPTQLFVRLTAADLANVVMVTGTGTLNLYVGGVAGPNTVALTVTTNPIISGITDGASLVTASSVSPYEILSIFGDNFTTSTLYGVATSDRFPVKLNDGLQDLQVRFYLTGNNLTDCTSTGGSGAAGATHELASEPNAYLLFATPNQINLLVPSGVATSTQICVRYGLTGGAAAVSAVKNLTVAAATPGIFTFGGGLGQGVVVNAVDGTINGSSNPVHPGGTITLYLSGAGALGGTVNAATYAGSLPTALPIVVADCASIASTWAEANALDTLGWADVDGAVMDHTFFESGGSTATMYAPCIDPTTVAVSIGSGQPGSGTSTLFTTQYAGWVADSVAGLYQINATLPSTISSTTTTTGTASQYYLTVTVGGTLSGGIVSGGSASQSGVYIYIK